MIVIMSSGRGQSMKVGRGGREGSTSKKLLIFFWKGLEFRLVIRRISLICAQFV